MILDHRTLHIQPSGRTDHGGHITLEDLWNLQAWWRLRERQVDCCVFKRAARRGRQNHAKLKWSKRSLYWLFEWIETVSTPLLRKRICFPTQPVFTLRCFFLIKSKIKKEIKWRNGADRSVLWYWRTLYSAQLNPAIWPSYNFSLLWKYWSLGWEVFTVTGKGEKKKKYWSGVSGWAYNRDVEVKLGDLCCDLVLQLNLLLFSAAWFSLVEINRCSLQF